MRHPATKGKADSNHKAIREAIELLGFPVMDLHAAGNGVEDLLVGLQRRLANTHLQHYWLLVECKVPVNAKGTVRFKPAQLKWRERSEGWPRITVTSAQDAVEQIRRMTG
jgi:hypothetical protein